MHNILLLYFISKSKIRILISQSLILVIVVLYLMYFIKNQLQKDLFRFGLVGKGHIGFGFAQMGLVVFCWVWMWTVFLTGIGLTRLIARMALALRSSPMPVFRRALGTVPIPVPSLAAPLTGGFAL